MGIGNKPTFLEATHYFALLLLLLLLLCPMS
jgi:hypothetical protein